MLSWLFQVIIVSGHPLGGADGGSRHDRPISYTPQVVECPSTPLLRNASDGLCDREIQWIKGRQEVVQPILLDWLQNSGLDDFDNTYLDTRANIALALSGGGYRAMLSGAGQLAALDARTGGSDGDGHMGGLLQASTYISGLSGGSWLLSSLVANHWASVEDLQNTFWRLENTMMDPYNTTAENAGFYARIYAQVRSKASAGFDTSMTDIYGRALSQQLYKPEVRDNTWSGVQQYPEFQEFKMPFPIMVADGTASHSSRVDDSSVIYEFSPFEMGSWDHELAKFTDLQYIGSNVIKGNPQGTCINNFDSIGFLSGTSSTVFNGVTADQIHNFTILEVAGHPKHAKAESPSVNGPADWQVSSFRPNPFYDPDGRSLVNQTKLRIADGGEDGENIPLAPFLEPSRKVDVVFAFDNSADTVGPTNNGYPNGNAMVAVANRKTSLYSSQYAFPQIPSTSQFLKRGLTDKPVFFGCDARDQQSPLIVYLANTRRSYESNVPTMKLSYTHQEVNGMIQNGYNVVTGNNGTISSDWRTCIACAVVLRDQQKKGRSASDQCAKCYEKYCWNDQSNGSESEVET